MMSSSVARRDSVVEDLIARLRAAKREYWPLRLRPAHVGVIHENVTPWLEAGLSMRIKYRIGNAYKRFSGARLSKSEVQAIDAERLAKALTGPDE